MGRTLEKLAASRNVRENRARIAEKVKSGELSGRKYDQVRDRYRNQDYGQKMSVSTASGKTSPQEAKALSLKGKRQRNSHLKRSSQGNNANLHHGINSNQTTYSRLGNEYAPQQRQELASKAAKRLLNGESFSSDKNTFQDQMKRISQKKGGKGIINTFSKHRGSYFSPLKHKFSGGATKEIHDIVNQNKKGNLRSFASNDMYSKAVDRVKKRKEKAINDKKILNSFINRTEDVAGPFFAHEKTPIDDYIIDRKIKDNLEEFKNMIRGKEPFDLSGNSKSASPEPPKSEPKTPPRKNPIADFAKKNMHKEKEVPKVKNGFFGKALKTIGNNKGKIGLGLAGLGLAGAGTYAATRGEDKKD